MEPIRLIRTTAELSSTAYFEFLPGEYRDACWNEQSVFLTEAVFDLIEPIFVRHEPRFDHYAFVGIRRPTWELILADLDHVATAAGHREVATMAGELTTWLREQLIRHECVSVLGM